MAVSQRGAMAARGFSHDGAQRALTALTGRSRRPDITPVLVENQRRDLALGVALKGQRGLHHVVHEVIRAVLEHREGRLCGALGKKRAPAPVISIRVSGAEPSPAGGA